MRKVAPKHQNAALKRVMARSQKQTSSRSFFDKWTPRQKIGALSLFTLSYFILLSIGQRIVPYLPVDRMIQSLDQLVAPAPEYLEEPTTKSKLIVEKQAPKPFMIETKEKPQLDHRMFFKEIEHGTLYLEQFSYLNMLQKIGSMTQEEILEKVGEQEKEEVITFKHAMHVPTRLPGRFVRFFGSIVHLKEIKAPRNPWGLEKMWEGQIMDGQFNIISFQVIDEPVNLYENFDNAMVTGLYFKTWVYYDPQGEPRLSPLILGRKLVKRYKKR